MISEQKRIEIVTNWVLSSKEYRTIVSAKERLKERLIIMSEEILSRDEKRYIKTLEKKGYPLSQAINFQSEFMIGRWANVMINRLEKKDGVPKDTITALRSSSKVITALHSGKAAGVTAINRRIPEISSLCDFGLKLEPVKLYYMFDTYIYESMNNFACNFPKETEEIDGLVIEIVKNYNTIFHKMTALTTFLISPNVDFKSVKKYYPEILSHEKEEDKKSDIE